MNKLAAETLGTFVLVFSGTGAIVANDASGGAVTPVGISLVFGLVVMALVYAIGDISGAHINPAVTLGFWAAGRFPAKLVAPYIVSQLVGAFAASLLLDVLFLDHPNLGATLPSGTWRQSFILEVVLTAMLMFVIMCVSTGSKEKGIMAGAAIGAVIAYEALFAGPICGASMNPARSLAPAVVSGATRDLWVYVVAPVLGSWLGLLSWYAVRPPASAAAPEPSKSEPEPVASEASS